MLSLRIPHRIALCVAFFAVPLMVLLYFYVKNVQESTNFTEMEMKGAQYLVPVVGLFENVGEHQLNGIMLSLGDQKAGAKLQQQAALIDTKFQELEAMQRTYGIDLQFTDEGLAQRKREQLKLDKVKAKWTSIRARSGAAPAALANDYRSLQEDIKGIIMHAGDTSNLILDPDLDSYYTMDTVLLAIPAQLDHLNQLGVDFNKSAMELAGEPVNEKVAMQLAVSKSLLQQDLDRVKASLGSAFNEDENFNGKSATFESSVMPKLQVYQSDAEALIKLVDDTIVSRMMDKPKIEQMGTQLVKTQESTVALWNAANQELQVQLGVRNSITLSARNIALGALGIALLLALGLFWYIARGITRPLSDLQAAMVDIAGGDLAREVPHLQKKDEIGAMAKTLAQFKETSKQANQLQAQQSSETETRLKRQQVMESQIQEFNKKSAALLQAVSLAASGMQKSAESMVDDAKATSERTQETSLATSETSQMVSVVAAASEELSASINEISRQVTAAAAITQQTVEMTRSTDTTVNHLAASANKISEVIDLIGSIAEQINLLALNATIESARAGEAGKGFAVVASEVKTLATQTAKATEAIVSQVSEIQNVVGSVVATLKSINGRINEMDGVSTTIASAVEEQGAATREIAHNIQMTATRIQEVTTNLGQVGNMSEQTNSNAKQVLDGVKNFSRQSENLNEEIEMFLTNIAKA